MPQGWQLLGTKEGAPPLQTLKVKLRFNNRRVGCKEVEPENLHYCWQSEKKKKFQKKLVWLLDLQLTVQGKKKKRKKHHFICKLSKCIQKVTGWCSFLHSVCKITLPELNLISITAFDSLQIILRVLLRDKMAAGCDHMHTDSVMEWEKHLGMLISSFLVSY